MSACSPNRIHFAKDELTFGESFGPVRSVTPIHFAGNGHQPHIECRFTGGLRLTFTPQSFIELLREGQQALAKLPYPPEVPDAVGGLQ
jgi:hypothetical protein